MILESRRWHLLLSGAWVIAFASWFLATTRSLLDQDLVPASTDLAVWAALVMVQAIIWGFVAYANLGILSSLGRARVGWWRAAAFVVVTFFVLALPLGATAIVGIEILGAPSTGYVGGVIQVAGFVSVIPAILVIYNSRTISINRESTLPIRAPRSAQRVCVVPSRRRHGLVKT